MYLIIYYVSVCVFVPLDAMNQEILILFAVFVVGAVTTLVRAILFQLAGERFVARLRKNVSEKGRFYKSLCILSKYECMCTVDKLVHAFERTLSTHTALLLHYKPRHRFL